MARMQPAHASSPHSSVDQAWYVRTFRHVTVVTDATSTCRLIAHLMRAASCVQTAAVIQEGMVVVMYKEASGPLKEWLT